MAPRPSFRVPHPMPSGHRDHPDAPGALTTMRGLPAVSCDAPIIETHRCFALALRTSEAAGKAGWR